jgi:hypothetical protein
MVGKGLAPTYVGGYIQARNLRTVKYAAYCRVNVGKATKTLLALRAAARSQHEWGHL